MGKSDKAEAERLCWILQHERLSHVLREEFFDACRWFENEGIPARTLYDAAVDGRLRDAIDIIRNSKSKYNDG